MKVTHIPFSKTGYFSKVIEHYLEKNTVIRPFYHHFPDIEGFYKQIAEKKKSFSVQSRISLVKELENQYKNIASSPKTKQHITALSQNNTFTVTTGHQLNLFTGPLYFLYKIITTINLCEELQEQFPEENFVPIYWMATEDHNFKEINSFSFQGKKVQWNKTGGGAVGRFSIDGLQDVFTEFSKHVGTSKNAHYLRQLFYDGYVKHRNLADATRFIVNELFGKYGLVIIDADTTALKTLFIPFLKEEILQNNSHTSVLNTIKILEKNYKIQVNPREINLFYVTDEIRERIIKKNGKYLINNTEITFTEEGVLKEIDDFPERFSPNVIIRPLYQEILLPNLCYVGGGGELAYWFELKNYFEAVKVPFPILVLRNSVQIISEKQQKKLEKLHISIEELFLRQNDLIAKKIKENSELPMDFSTQITFLKKQFEKLKIIAKKTDASFLGAVNAQEQKQIKGLKNLEKRLLKAEKRVQKEVVQRIVELQNELFPNQHLEERQRNFSEYYILYGENFITSLKDNLKPLQLEFTVLEL